MVCKKRRFPIGNIKQPQPVPEVSSRDPCPGRVNRANSEDGHKQTLHLIRKNTTLPFMLAQSHNAFIQELDTLARINFTFAVR